MKKAPEATRRPVPRPPCCVDYAHHRRPLTGYHYRAANGWHCWQCDGRRDDGYRYCRPVAPPVVAS